MKKKIDKLTKRYHYDNEKGSQKEKDIWNHITDRGEDSYPEYIYIFLMLMNFYEKHKHIQVRSEQRN